MNFVFLFIDFCKSGMTRGKGLVFLDPEIIVKVTQIAKKVINKAIIWN